MPDELQLRNRNPGFPRTLENDFVSPGGSSVQDPQILLILGSWESWVPAPDEFGWAPRSSPSRLRVPAVARN